MRINEIANAEEQLALWKLISNNIWTTISQQAEVERKQRAEKAAQRKLKPKYGGKRGGRKSLPPPPHITPPPPPKKPPPPQANTEVGMQPTQQIAVGAKQQQANAVNPQAQQQSTTSAAQAHKQLAGPQAALAHTTPTQLSAAQQPLSPQQLRLQRQNTGYLAKNTAAAKTQ
jgi:hypothetical protein